MVHKICVKTSTMQASKLINAYLCESRSNNRHQKAIVDILQELVGYEGMRDLGFKKEGYRK